ncbi:MAG: glycine cleavage system aminomethyltransferase GcvT [Sphingobium sp.]
MSESQQTENTEEGTEIELGMLPLDAWHRAQGGRMVGFAGYHMPIQYEGIMAEHLWTRAHAGLFDVSHMGQLSFTGEDVDAALEAVIPASIASLATGRQRYSMLLDEEGGILDDLMVARRPDDIYMVVNGATKYDDIGWLLEHLPDEVTINLMDEQALLALQGPEAVTALSRLIPGVEALYFMQCGGFDWNGHSLWISRSGYTGEDGFEISLPAEAAEAFADTLCAMEEVKPIGLGARDSLRLEAGLPLYGHDLTPATDPVEAGLSFAIGPKRRKDGGFIGAERVLEYLADARGMSRVGLLVEGRLPAREGAAIYDENPHPIGNVTSGGFSPTLQRPIAMGYIDAALSEPGTPLEIEVRGKRIAATVASMPFVPHTYHRQPAAPKGGSQ